MATVGFSQVIITVLDKNEKATAQKFTLDGKSNKNGVVEANITGLAPTLTKNYASDMAIDVSAKGTGDIKMDLSVFDLPDDCMSAVTGMQKEDGIYKHGNETQAPYVSVECISADTQGNGIHIALLKGMFGVPDKDLKSNDNNVQVAQDKISGDFINRAADGFAYGKTNESDTDYDAAKWETFVRPAVAG